MVSLAKIFALSREELGPLLVSQGRALSPDEKDINKDRAVVALLYNHYNMISSQEDKNIISRPDFYTTIASTSSLEEAMAVFNRVLPEVPPSDIGGVIVEYLEPEEAFVYSIVYPDKRLIKQRSETTLQQAFSYAVKKGWLEGAIALHNYAEEPKGYTLNIAGCLENAGESGSLDMMRWIMQYTEPIYWGLIVNGASIGGHLSLLDKNMDFNQITPYFIPKMTQVTSTHMLREAAKGNHMNVINWLGEHIHLQWKQILFDASSWGEVNLMNIAADWLDEYTKPNWRLIASNASLKGKVELMKVALSKSKDPKLLSTLIEHAIHRHDVSSLDYILGIGGIINARCLSVLFSTPSTNVEKFTAMLNYIFVRSGVKLHNAFMLAADYEEFIAMDFFLNMPNSSDIDLKAALESLRSKVKSHQDEIKRVQEKLEILQKTEDEGKEEKGEDEDEEENETSLENDLAHLEHDIESSLEVIEWIEERLKKI